MNMAAHWRYNSSYEVCRFQLGTSSSSLLTEVPRQSVTRHFPPLPTWLQHCGTRLATCDLRRYNWHVLNLSFRASPLAADMWVLCARFRHVDHCDANALQTLMLVQPRFSAAVYDRFNWSTHFLMKLPNIKLRIRTKTRTKQFHCWGAQSIHHDSAQR
jgi:hypothetical protein